MFPLAPLYDSTTNSLKQNAIDVLEFIFGLVDWNNDGIIDDEELVVFQVACFGNPLQRLEITSIKNEISYRDSNGIDGGITKSGFLLLMSLYIQRGRVETVWTIIRTFGYADDFSLRPDFLVPNGYE